MFVLVYTEPSCTVSQVLTCAISGRCVTSCEWLQPTRQHTSWSTTTSRRTMTTQARIKRCRRGNKTLLCSTSVLSHILLVLEKQTHDFTCENYWHRLLKRGLPMNMVRYAHGSSSQQAHRVTEHASKEFTELLPVLGKVCCARPDVALSGCRSASCAERQKLARMLKAS
jgi:hypothetical protein